MPKLEIELTAGQELALCLVAKDPQEWVENVATARAQDAKDALKTDPDWTKAAVALATDGGDAGDDWAVLLKGRDMGLFVTQEELAAMKEAETATGIAVAETVAPSAALVEQEVTLRKIALVEADNVSQMQDIIQRGMLDGFRLMRAEGTRNLTDFEKHRVAEIERITVAIDAIEAAGTAIKADIASGAITTINQVKTDARWPQ